MKAGNGLRHGSGRGRGTGRFLGSVFGSSEKRKSGREGPPFSEAILECYATAGQCIWPGRALWPNLARAKMFVLTRCPSRLPSNLPVYLLANTLAALNYSGIREYL